MLQSLKVDENIFFFVSCGSFSFQKPIKGPLCRPSEGKSPNFFFFLRVCFACLRKQRGLGLPSPGPTWLVSPAVALRCRPPVGCFVEPLSSDTTPPAPRPGSTCIHARPATKPVSSSRFFPCQYFDITLSSQLITFWSHDLQISQHCLRKWKLLHINTGTNLPWIDSHPRPPNKFRKTHLFVIILPKGKKILGVRKSSREYSLSPLVVS